MSTTDFREAFPSSPATVEAPTWAELDRDVEARSVPMRDPELWEEMFGEGSRKAGVRVSSSTSMGLPAFWRCVHLISGDAMRLPCELYRDLGDDPQPIEGDPRRRIVRLRANKRTSSRGWVRQLVAQYLMHGNGYSKIVRGAQGIPLEVWNIPSSRMSVVPGLEEGERGYLWTDAKGRQHAELEENIVHLRAVEDDELLEGLSVVEKARQALGLGIATDTTGERFFSKGARPGMILRPKFKTSAAERAEARRQFEEAVAGVDKSFGVVVVPQGYDLEDWQMSMVDAQWIDTRKMTAVDVANLFGVPPHKVGSEARTSYASLEQEEQSYLDGAVDPVLVALEAELGLKLFSPRELEQDLKYFKFNRSALVRADFETTRRGLAIEVQNGIINRAEARKLLDRPKGPPELEEFVVPAGTQLVGEKDDPPSEPAPPPPPGEGGDQGDEGDEPPGGPPAPPPPPSTPTPEARAAARELVADAVLRCCERTRKQKPDRLVSARNRLVLTGMLEHAVRAAWLLEGRREEPDAAIADMVGDLTARKPAEEVLRHAR